MGLSDSLPGRPAVMHSHGALVAFARARQGLPGSSADLPTRAVPNHPGRSDDCIRLLLRHRSCLASSKSGGLATFVFLSRPNRVHLRYGSRVRLASPPAPSLELALARLRAEQAIYTMNSFQFIRSTRLILAYPTSGRRHPVPGWNGFEDHIGPIDSVMPKKTHSGFHGWASGGGIRNCCSNSTGGR
jgi:hypothetical protein